MATFTYDFDARIMTVDSPFVTTTVQEMLNSIRDVEDDIANIDDDIIAVASGKQDLGGGVSVGITLELVNDWKLAFEARGGPTELMTVTGGNLLARDLAGDIVFPIAPTAFTAVTIAQSSSATLIGAEAGLITQYLGAIWIDAANGVPGTTVGVHGLPQNPVDTQADALTLADETGLRHIVAVSGNLLLTESMTEFFVEMRDEIEINFGGQNINGSEFIGGKIKGTMTGRIVVRGAEIEDVVGFRGEAVGCGLTGTISLGAGRSTMADCHSRVPGFATPMLSFGATSELSFRGYSGGIELETMTAVANKSTCEFIAGQIIIGATNTLGTLIVRGLVDPVTDSSGAGLIKDFSGVVSKLAIADFLETSGPNAHGTGVWTGSSPTDIRDVALAGSAVGSLGEGVLIAKNTKLAMRIDNYSRNGVGFPTTARLRIFPDQATADLSSKDGAGLEGAIAVTTLTSLPDGTFAVLPDDILAGA